VCRVPVWPYSWQAWLSRRKAASLSRCHAAVVRPESRRLALRRRSSACWQPPQSFRAGSIVQAQRGQSLTTGTATYRPCLNCETRFGGGLDGSCFGVSFGGGTGFGAMGTHLPIPRGWLRLLRARMRRVGAARDG
jgi:hypothetical protein